MSLKQEIDDSVKVLKDELHSAVDIFNYYNIPEDLQKRIIEYGVSYDYIGDGYRSCRKLSAVGFSKILIYCKENNIELNNLDKILGVLFYHMEYDEEGDFLDFRVYKQLSRIIDQMYSKEESNEESEPKKLRIQFKFTRPVF